MIIRRYETKDLTQILLLFYDTVHNINKADYDEEQLYAWADGRPDPDRWDRSFYEHYSIIAEENGRIIGFGDIDHKGFIDRLFVHMDHQRKGVASAICEELEKNVRSDKITVQASVTARPFFEKRGYKVLKQIKAVRKGIALTAFIMEK